MGICQLKITTASLLQKSVKMYKATNSKLEHEFFITRVRALVCAKPDTLLLFLFNLYHQFILGANSNQESKTFSEENKVVDHAEVTYITGDQGNTTLSESENGSSYTKINVTECQFALFVMGEYYGAV